MAKKPPVEESKSSAGSELAVGPEARAKRTDPRLVALALKQPQRKATPAGALMAKTAVKHHRAPSSRVSKRVNGRGDTRTAEDVEHAKAAYEKNPNMVTLAVLSNVRKLAAAG